MVCSIVKYSVPFCPQTGLSIKGIVTARAAVINSHRVSTNLNQRCCAHYILNEINNLVIMLGASAKEDVLVDHKV